MNDLLPDVQNTYGDFRYSVKAGIKGLIVPIQVKTREGGIQITPATAEMYVLLPACLRGINMSRLPIILNDMQADHWVLDDLEKILRRMCDMVGSSAAALRLDFKYFYDKAAPVTGHVGKAYVDVAFISSLRVCTEPRVGCHDYYWLRLAVTVPVTTLCPCSKEISSASAHNQRAFVTVEVSYDDFVWIEELVELVEECSSSAVYPILKRPDEKFVTEKAYSRPRFVEDLAREVAGRLSSDKRIIHFYVTVRSEESIHQHDAVAIISSGGEFATWYS